MRLLHDNSSFMDGTFSGFDSPNDVHGKVAGSIRTRGGELLEPKYGRRFAILDYPYLINDDWERITSPSVNTHPVDTSYIRFDDKDGNETVGADGALLSYSVSADKFKAGDTLIFDWRFLTFRTNWNDFAFFFAYEGNGTLKNAIEDQKITTRKLLTESLTLEDAGASHTDWKQHPWKVPRDFSGKLVWVVSNGESVDPSQPEASLGAFARPSALLIDGIFIKKA